MNVLVINIKTIVKQRVQICLTAVYLESVCLQSEHLPGLNNSVKFANLIIYVVVDTTSPSSGKAAITQKLTIATVY